LAHHRTNSETFNLIIRNQGFSYMRLALYQPDIAQNTGTILRLCACLGVAVDVIGPTGFDMSDRALKRAALDYLDHVDLTRHASFSDFINSRTPNENRRQSGRLVLLSAHAEMPHYKFAFDPSDTLMLGRESAGVPESVHSLADARITIPMRPGLRSLNVAVTAALVLGEALRQTSGFPSHS
jgi:tRNA (cytidine/uridine-2'-O-)-methyltransferase